MSGNRYKVERYVKRALDEAGYIYTDVGSAEGWLKKELVSPADYDLLIISSELTGKISGEYFDYINERLQKVPGSSWKCGILTVCPKARSKDSRSVW